MTTQHELLASDEVAKSVPILHETALLIADPQVRYRGTIGGNVANGDPGNDMPALMMTLGAFYRPRRQVRRARCRSFRILSRRLFHRARARRNPDLDLDPGAAGRSRLRLQKLKRKVGDYATAAAAVVLTMAGGKVATCSIGLTNLAETPLLAGDARKPLLAPASMRRR
jgi:carbon-monoxide dehydrogenase medium subunit